MENGKSILTQLKLNSSSNSVNSRSLASKFSIYWKYCLERLQPPIALCQFRHLLRDSKTAKVAEMGYCTRRLADCSMKILIGKYTNTRYSCTLDRSYNLMILKTPTTIALTHWKFQHSQDLL